jgi:hypothetical protein
MISRKHLIYIKNKLRRGAKNDRTLGWLMPGFAPYKTTLRDIIRGLRLYRQISHFALSYEGMVTKRLGRGAYRNLITCIECSANKVDTAALIEYYQFLDSLVAKK